ncbi:MAG: ABC transporter permease subunit, partial [Gaiellaceae bacterium]
MSTVTSFWRSRYRDPVIALAVFAALAIFPLFADPLGSTLDFAIYAVAYVIFALGLNIVVGFAGLLDLGYVAFFAIGAYAVGWFASDHFSAINGGKGLHVGVDTAQLPEAAGIHVNFLILIVVAAIVASIAGA